MLNQFGQCHCNEACHEHLATLQQCAPCTYWYNFLVISHAHHSQVKRVAILYKLPLECLDSYNASIVISQHNYIVHNICKTIFLDLVINSFAYKYLITKVVLKLVQHVKTDLDIIYTYICVSLEYIYIYNIIILAII